ncbi:VUT family protein, partial [Candidatus Babeliales bacterium]|nr:VUT family protein [Candidatus Babeliales bacterium]
LRLFLYERLQRLSNHESHKFLFARNLSVTVVEQALDTVLFGFLGLYGVVHSVTDVFVVSFSIKMLTILCMSPAVLWAKK